MGDGVKDLSAFVTLKYRAPGVKRMRSTTVRKPAHWHEMRREERRAWAQAECERVCPGATEVALR